MAAEARMDGGQVSEALQRVLRSQTFARSERLRAFLKFIVETEQLGLAHRLKGYTIGIDVFSRGDGFDPGTDPLVRVQAGKLRKLLNQFYACEGRHEVLRIRIPIGGYVPVYERMVDEKRSASAGSGFDRIEAHFEGRAEQVLAEGAGFLPRLFLRPAGSGDQLASIFVNATRLWSSRLWAVMIATPDEKPLMVGGAPHPLHFELKAQGKGHILKLDLRHLRSGNTVPLTNSSFETTGDSLEIGAIANQFAGANLTIPGSIFRFCQLHELATGQMECLDATYRYALEGTDSAYVTARRSQQQWAGLGPSGEIITEMSKLIERSCLMR